MPGEAVTLKMYFAYLLTLAGVSFSSASTLERDYEPLYKRLDNGLGKTPALGWNGWVCS